MITDLFSHKIHASTDDWPDKLVEYASIFAQFDGSVYDRTAIEEKLAAISPRSAYAPRDQSKFRDEVSAYQPILGLYRLEDSPGGWRLFVTETARRFLVSEEPDVEAFVRLQLTLYQIPNGGGATYRPGTHGIRIQANAADARLAEVEAGMHLSPLRLICKALRADSLLRQVEITQAVISYEEMYALANSAHIYKTACPSTETVQESLGRVRNGELHAPAHYERRFSLLPHTGLFTVGQGTIRLRQPAGNDDLEDLKRKIVAIEQVKAQYDGFDAVRDRQQLEEIARSGAWGRYFDGVATLPGHVVSVLGSDLLNRERPVPPQDFWVVPPPQNLALRERGDRPPPPAPANRDRELADPEVTRIKRQRRNLAHKVLLDRVDDLVRRLGARPSDSPHIDLYANIPNDGAFLFEVKSGGESLLDQIRKGLSQLYEYRFRYRDNLQPNVVLCLVLGENPSHITWVAEYLCNDRQVTVCWFDADGTLRYPALCRDQLGVLNAEENDHAQGD